MKKLFALFIGITMILTASLGAVTTVYAKKSINDETRDVVVVDEPSGVVTIIDNLDYSKIDNKDVSDAVKKVNTGEKTTPADVARLIEQQVDAKKNVESFPTTDGLEVNLELYDYITQFDNIEISGKNKDVRIRVPAAVQLDASEIMVMHINSKTGEISLIIPKDFDPETGEMTVTFPDSGVFALMQKVPLIVRDVHPDEYNNEDVAAAIRSLPVDEFIELRDWLQAFGNNDDKLKVADGVTVNVDDYNSANFMADMAVQYSLTKFGYDLSTKVNADLNQQLDDIDYERILDYAGIEFDAEAVKEDRTLLEKIEPFVLEDCFVFHVDAATGETSIAYEPEISFKQTESLDQMSVKIFNEDVHDDKIDVLDEISDNGLFWTAYADENTELTERNEKILTWDIHDIDNDDDDQMNIVMSHDKYLGMGPFILLMPKEKTADFPWWILILVAAAGGIGAVAKKKHDDNKNTTLTE